MMRLGYDRPLHLLPFDHRHAFVTEIFHFGAPLNAQQKGAVCDCKAVIYEGFREALATPSRLVAAAFSSTRNSARLSCMRR